MAEKWVAALRSGKYKQGRDILIQVVDGEPQYCCLGVACKLFADDRISEWRDETFIPSKLISVMPIDLIHINNFTSILAGLNDYGITVHKREELKTKYGIDVKLGIYTFEDIADFIEENTEFL